MGKGKIQEINDRLAVVVTSGVATMWCAYIFAGLAVWGGTGVDWRNSFQIVQWISQTFLQLVLLSIIMVGQKVLTAASDAQAKEMHDAVIQELEIAKADRLEIIDLHKDLHRLLSQGRMMEDRGKEKPQNDVNFKDEI